MFISKKKFEEAMFDKTTEIVDEILRIIDAELNTYDSNIKYYTNWISDEKISCEERGEDPNASRFICQYTILANEIKLKKIELIKMRNKILTHYK